MELEMHLVGHLQMVLLLELVVYSVGYLQSVLILELVVYSVVLCLCHIDWVVWDCCLNLVHHVLFLFPFLSLCSQLLQL